MRGWGMRNEEGMRREEENEMYPDQMFQTYKKLMG